MWKTHGFLRKTIYNYWIFQIYVSLPQGKSNQIPYGLSTADCDAHPAFGQWQGAQHQRGTHQGSQQDPAQR